MASQDNMMSINTVAARLGLSVHQLRRWELMFGLEIKRGRGQQRQYRPEDMTILERIKELVEQGWPTSQIRPQIEAEGLITPKLIGMPTPPGNPEVVLESLIGMRTFCERRFIEISRQIDELRQLVISLSLKQELSGESDSPWQPMEPPEMIKEEARPMMPAQEINLGPEMKAAVIPPPNYEPGSPPVVAPPPAVEAVSLGEVTDQNYLTVLGRALDLIGWTDEEADEYSEKTFGVPHWDELGRSQAERLVAHLTVLLNEDRGATGGVAEDQAMPSGETAGIADQLMSPSETAGIAEQFMPASETAQEAPAAKPPEEMHFGVGGAADMGTPAGGQGAAAHGDDYDEFYEEDINNAGGGAPPSTTEEGGQHDPQRPPYEPPA
ncbi:MAG: helix-turn-helix domain-containing protein [Candidatus Melainabacteria bacterium]|nr:helix-turn-helix domain-containing protein [Candidatus Melainabacteria bacterium]